VVTVAIVATVVEVATVVTVVTVTVVVVVTAVTAVTVEELRKKHYLTKSANSEEKRRLSRTKVFERPQSIM
jgi:hypothetical protein